MQIKLSSIEKVLRLGLQCLRTHFKLVCHPLPGTDEACICVELVPCIDHWVTMVLLLYFEQIDISLYRSYRTLLGF
jgi:hypothetical protein